MRRLSALLLAVVACKEADPRGNGFFVMPAVVDFGEVVVGLLERRALTLDNQTPQVVRVIEARPTDPIAGAIRLERVPAALLAGSSAEAEIVFAPPGEGVFSGPIQIMTDADPPEQTVWINGVGVAPFLRAIPESIDFGRVQIMSTAVWTATITNEGGTPVTINAITLDMESGTEFEIGPYAIEVLDPGESFNFDVMFTPMAGGRQVGRLAINDDSPRPVPLTIELIGEGVDGDLEIEPIGFDFTGALVGEVRSRFLTIRNTGSSTHTIDAIELTQAQPAAFSVVTASISFPQPLAPGREQRVEVRFAPAVPTSHNGTIEVRSSASVASISLFGLAYAPPVSALEVAPRAIDFGGVEIGSSGARELTLDSSGYLEVHLDGAIELDPPDAPFLLSRAPAADTTLSAFDSHTLEVLYLPETVESHSAVLRIRSDAANDQEIEIPLSGRGEADASSDADPRPARLVFGAVPRETNAYRTVILFNGGTAPLSITAVEVTEDAGGLFVLQGGFDPSPFGRGERRPIQIRYSDPAGLAQARTGTVTISTDDPDRPAIRVPLSAYTTAPRPEDDLRIRIDALDLHLIESGALFDRPTDCCWCNPNPPWGDVFGSPFLDNDFTGSKTIRLSEAGGQYIVEVHSREAEAATAEVTIEIRGSPPIVRTREVGPGQRWRVGTIGFAGDRGFFSTASLPLDTPMDDSCY